MQKFTRQSIGDGSVVEVYLWDGDSGLMVGRVEEVIQYGTHEYAAWVEGSTQPVRFAWPKEAFDHIERAVLTR